MPTLEALYRQDPESLPFRQPVDPTLLGIPVNLYLFFYFKAKIIKSDLIAIVMGFGVFRTTLTLWRTPLTFLPSRGSWTPGSTKSPGSTWMTSGSCSTTPGSTIARRPESISTARSSLRSLSRRSTPSCRVWGIAVGARWGFQNYTKFKII